MKKQTTFYIDSDVFMEFKRKCLLNDIPMSKVCNRLLKEYVDESTDNNHSNTNVSVDGGMTVTDSMSVSLKPNVEEKSWIKRKLNL